MRRDPQAFGLGLGFFLGVDVNRVGLLGLGSLLLRDFLGIRLISGLVIRLTHAFLKALDGAAKILAHILQLACAEDEHNDGKDDQPVPNGKRTDFFLLKLVLPRAGTAKDVDVQMRNFLTAVAAGINNHAETVVAALFLGELAYKAKHFT